MEKEDKSLEKALEYMCTLPKVYVEKLGLDKKIFFAIMGHLCEIQRAEEDSDAPKYMQLEYDVVLKYCAEEFTQKYVCGHYAQYCRTIDAAILTYYRILKNDGKLTREKQDRMFGAHFLEERVLEKLDEGVILDCFDPRERERIQKEKQAGNLQKKFEENWRDGNNEILDNKIENNSIILKNFFAQEEYEKLIAGPSYKRAIDFLDKLENESHERCSDGVLIPYEEYHALHKLFLERPKVRETLQKKHDELADKLNRISRLTLTKKIKSD